MTALRFWLLQVKTFFLTAPLIFTSLVFNFSNIILGIINNNFGGQVGSQMIARTDFCLCLQGLNLPGAHIWATQAAQAGGERT